MTSPDQLSPGREPSPTPVPLPFEITWADVAGALPGFTGGGIARVSHVRRGMHQGGRPSVIMTLSYVGQGGRRCERTVFFKRNQDGAREAETYRYLAGRGFSVSDLLICLDRADHEVMGLEFLPSIGLQPSDLDDVLQLVAALNSIDDAPATIATTPVGMAQAEFEELLGAAAEDVARGWPEHRPDLWVDLYRRAVHVHGQLPRALTHGELAAQQVGRTRDGRLVVFDLATVGERPRFADLANVLQLLVRLSGVDERSVLSQYLRHLSAVGGPRCSVEQALGELRLTRFVQELEALPWRTSLNDPADLHQHVVTIAADYLIVRSQLGT